MTIINGYCSTSEFKAALGIDETDDADDDPIDAAITAASRHLEQHAGRGRKWWRDPTAVARFFYPSEAHRVWVNDIGATTDLAVAVDTAGDGTYSTTLTINTGFILEPVNATADGAAWTSLRRVDGGQWPYSPYGRPTVRVTAQYGWPSVPAQIKQACILQAKALYKSPDTNFGVFQTSIDGFSRTVPALDPMARAQLEGFIRFDPLDDEASDA